MSWIHTCAGLQNKESTIPFEVLQLIDVTKSFTKSHAGTSDSELIVISGCIENQLCNCYKFAQLRSLSGESPQVYAPELSSQFLKFFLVWLNLKRICICPSSLLLFIYSFFFLFAVHVLFPLWCLIFFFCQLLDKTHEYYLHLSLKCCPEVFLASMPFDIDMPRQEWHEW